MIIHGAGRVPNIGVYISKKPGLRLKRELLQSIIT